MAFAIDLPIDHPSSGVSASNPSPYRSASSWPSRTTTTARVLRCRPSGSSSVKAVSIAASSASASTSSGTSAGASPAGHGVAGSPGSTVGAGAGNDGSSSARVQPVPVLAYAVDGHRPRRLTRTVPSESSAVVRRNGTSGLSGRSPIPSSTDRPLTKCAEHVVFAA